MALWDIVAGPILHIIDKVIPDPAAKAQAQLEVLKLQQDGELQRIEKDIQIQLAQIDLDKTEAQSTSGFRANWRPAAGWVCVCALGYAYIAQPLLGWLSSTPPPKLELQDLVSLLFAMLGFGTLRTTEKIKGLP